jgi:hypothetical protein
MIIFPLHGLLGNKLIPEELLFRNLMGIYKRARFEPTPVEFITRRYKKDFMKYSGALSENVERTFTFFLLRFFFDTHRETPFPKSP